METRALVMVAATPAKLRLGGTVKQLGLRVALTQTAIQYVIVVMAQSQGLKTVMMETPPMAMVATAPAKRRADGIAQRLVPPVALTQTAMGYVTRVVMAQS